MKMNTRGLFGWVGWLVGWWSEGHDDGAVQGTNRKSESKKRELHK
jgi:hypothetical protein